MGRSPSCDNITGLKKGAWTQEEDLKLTQYIQIHGPGNWRTLPKNAGLQRCGKSCRLRWINYLRPDIKRGRFSFEEELTIIQLHSVLGNKWSLIAAQLPGRTDNEIKNYWNTHIRKALLKNGVDPLTHHPRLDLLDVSSSFNLSNLFSIQALVNPQVLWLAALLASATASSSSISSLNEDNKELFFNNNVYPMNQKPSEQIANVTSTPPLLPINQLWNLAPQTQENNGQCFSDSLINLNIQTSQENMISPYLTDNSITIPDCSQIPSQALEYSSFQPSTSENINFNMEFDDEV